MITLELESGKTITLTQMDIDCVEVKVYGFDNCLEKTINLDASMIEDMVEDL